MIKSDKARQTKGFVFDPLLIKAPYHIPGKGALQGAGSTKKISRRAGDTFDKP
jgi:hypothetical protein